MVNSHSKSTRFCPEITLRIYREFKKNPNKVFVLNDFSLRDHSRQHIELLVKLGIIERVEVYYYCGNNYFARKKTKGYKLK